MPRAEDETVQTQSEEPAAPRTRTPRTSIPPRLGRYTVTRLLGQGGVGAVYEAVDPEVGRKVAIKILRDDRSGDTETLRREAQALGRLVHPNVVTVFDVGVVDGDVFLVMQLVEGVTIDAYLAARHASPVQIVAMFRQAGEGLVAAHAAGLVHCDFKPANVLVDGQGVVRVTDFGLARATKPATDSIAAASLVMAVAGTPAYMAPEQYDGVATAASDQFAFCVALWETLAGERPFEDSSIHATDVLAARGPVRALPATSRIPAHLVPILEKGLAPSPGDRYPSMAALLAAIAAARAPRRWPYVVGGLAMAGAIGAVVAWPRGGGGEAAWHGADVAATRHLTHGACDDAPVIDASGVVVFGRTAGDAIDLYAVPLTGGAPTQLTSSPRYEWRPGRGRRPGEVSFLVHLPGTDAGAYVAYLDLATHRETRALDVYAWDAAAAGDTLYYSPNEPAGIRRLAGTANTAFVDPPANSSYFLFDVSPAGDRLALVKTTTTGAPNRLCTADVASREVTCLDSRTSDGRPAFGADGTAVYFAAPDGIRRRELATGRETVIVPDVWSIGGVAVAPAGQALVYSLCRPNGAIAEAATRAVVVPDLDSDHPAIAPDGTLAWVRDVRGVGILVARTPDGRELELTDLAFGSVHDAAFSPDGRQLVFAGSPPNPGIHLLKLAVPGSMRQLTSDANDQRPTWLAGGAIGFMRVDATTSHAFIVGRDGATPRQLGTATRWVFGHRGDELLVDTGDDGTDSLRWLAATGAERPGPVRPAGAIHAAATSTDGAWIAFAMGPYGQDVYRAHGDAPPERVATYPAAITVTNLAIDNAGRVLVAQQTYAGDLYAVPAVAGARF